jgi:hypothetical protein
MMSEKNVKSLDELTPDQLVSALGAAMRSVTVRLIDCIGLAETRTALFAEAISIAQADMTPDQIAVMLRGLAQKIDSGELENTSH